MLDPVVDEKFTGEELLNSNRLLNETKVFSKSLCVTNDSNDIHRMPLTYARLTKKAGENIK